MGVDRMYRCGYNNYYFSLLHLYFLALFGSSIPISLFIFKMFFRSYILYNPFVSCPSLLSTYSSVRCIVLLCMTYLY